MFHILLLYKFVFLQYSNRLIISVRIIVTESLSVFLVMIDNLARLCLRLSQTDYTMIELDKLVMQTDWRCGMFEKIQRTKVKCGLSSVIYIKPQEELKISTELGKNIKWNKQNTFQALEISERYNTFLIAVKVWNNEYH